MPLFPGLVPGDEVNIGNEVEVKNDAGSPIPVSGPITDTELRASDVEVNDGVTQGKIDTVNTNLGTLETDVEATNTRLGEVSATPTANTVLDRLKAIGDNQLADNHQVTVSNQVTQPTTPSDTQPVSGTVTVANPTADPETGLAKETTLSAIKTAVEILDNAISGTEMQTDIVASLPAGTNTIGKVDLGATDNAVLDNIDTNTSGTSTNTSTIATNTNYRYSGGKTSVVSTVTSSGDTTVHTPAAGKAIRLYWVSAITDPDQLTSGLIKIGFGAGTSIDTELYRAFAVAHWEVFESNADDKLIVNLSESSSVAFTAHIEEFTP